MDAHTAMLIVAASERDANLYYATRFLAPDSFVFIQTATQKILLMSDLEIDRAKQQSTVDVVLSYSAYDKKLKDQGMTEPKAADVIKALLDEFGLTDLIVPTGHDGVLCDAIVLHQLHIDQFLDEFRGQRLSFIIELSLMDVSGFDDLDGVSDRFLRGLHGVQDVLDFVC